MSYFLLLALTLAVASPAVAIKAKRCPDGTYVVDGPVLVPTGDIGSHFDAISVEGKRVSTDSGCEAVRARFRRGRKGTRIQARWRECGDVARVRLRGLIDPDCLQLAGTLKIKGIGEKAFVAIVDPKYPPELHDGTPVVHGVACGGSPTLDAIETLCELTGATPCLSQSATCATHQRQLFAGTRLVNDPPDLGEQWNGRGGSGEPLADAVVCTLRELAPELGGPIVSIAPPVSLGPLGSIHVRQEVGFTKFDRLRERFEGYRRVEVDMPVVGKAQAITQRIVVDKVGASGGAYAAGAYPIQHAFGLNVETEDKEKILTFTPPGFVVGTPFGPVTVTPEFTYGARTGVIAAPYAGGNAANDVASLYENATWTVRLFDLYGTTPGLVNTAAATLPGTFASQRSGWASQLGFGTRAGVLGQASWTPPASGPITRPDADLLAPRSNTEAIPSVYVSARAEVAWPSHPSQILPEWVFDIPFLDPPIARLTVAPTVQAGVASQLFVTLSEGADHQHSGEFSFTSERLSTAALLAQAGTVGLFTVEAGVRISVTADFPFPVGAKTFVDIDKKIPIPLAFGSSPGNVNLAGASSTSVVSPDFPETLDVIGTFTSVHVGAAATASFLEQCYAPTPLAEQPVPVPEPEPGEPSDLFAGVLWPCNICIHTAGHPTLDLGTLRAQYEAQLPSHPGWPPWPENIPDDWVEVLAPAATPPAWLCNTSYNTGCYDLCTFDSTTNTLTVVLGPEQIIPLLPPTPAYDDERAVLVQCDVDPPA